MKELFSLLAAEMAMTVFLPKKDTVNNFSRVQENMNWDNTVLLPFVFKNEPDTMRLGIFAYYVVMPTQHSQLFTGAGGQYGGLELTLKGAREELNKEGVELIDKEWYAAETTVDVDASHQLHLFELRPKITVKASYPLQDHKLRTVIPAPTPAKTGKK